MNHQSVRRAKIVLHKMGLIHKRLNERAVARAVLKEHLAKLEKRPSKAGIAKVHELLDGVIRKEKELVKSGLLESDKIDSLHDKLNGLSREHSEMRGHIQWLEEQLADYHRIKAQEWRKHQIIEKKVEKAHQEKTKKLVQAVSDDKREVLRKRLSVFETKYNQLKKSGSVSKITLQKLEKKMKEIKKFL